MPRPKRKPVIKPVITQTEPVREEFANVEILENYDAPPQPVRAALVQVRAAQYYDNGTIRDRLGVNWRPGEVRTIPLDVFRSLVRDNPRNFTIV
jgi:hypothetical protein